MSAAVLHESRSPPTFAVFFPAHRRNVRHSGEGLHRTHRPVNEVYESSRFHRRVQLPDESVDGFYVELTLLAKKFS